MKSSGLALGVLFVTSGSLLAVGGSSVVACSGSSGATTSSGGGSSGAGSSGGSGGSSSSGASSGSGSSSGGSSSSSSGGAMPYTGLVFASSVSVANQSSHNVSGAFVMTSAPVGGCAGTMSGSCCYVGPADGGAGDAGTATLESAGTLTVKDASNTIATIMPGSSGAYSDNSATDMMLTWAAGDMLTFSAAGDKVHAFTGMVKAPDDITGTNPAFSNAMPAVVSVASDWVVTWTPGSDGSDTMELALSALKGISGDGLITCSGKDSDAMVTVPKDLLMKIGTTDTGSVSLTRAAVDMPADDNATVVLSATTLVSGLVKFGP